MEVSTQRKEPQQRIWLMYFPRACHHLFMRMLSTQKDFAMIEAVRHMDAYTGPTIQLSSIADLDSALDDCEALRSIAHERWKLWKNNVDDLESQGRRVFNSYSVAFHINPAMHNRYLNSRLGRGSSHAPVEATEKSSPASFTYWHLSPEETSQLNPTLFPDEFLRSHQPILLIRHPALAFPSAMRVAAGYFTFDITKTFMNIILRYSWHVMLYKWYIENHKRSLTGNPAHWAEPLILDSDDLMYNKAAVAELCRKTGLDPDRVQYTWTKTAVENTYAKEDVFTDTLAASEAILPGKSSVGLNIEDEATKWVVEFGLERGELLRELVVDAMPDYTYLRERSIGAGLEAAMND